MILFTAVFIDIEFVFAISSIASFVGASSTRFTSPVGLTKKFTGPPGVFIVLTVLPSVTYVVATGAVPGVEVVAACAAAFLAGVMGTYPAFLSFNVK